MDYNSTRERLVLPEYGRHIQNMVKHALTIENRDERNRCAKTIISLMGNMFPHLRDVNDFKHKLWDHLAIMSDFKLDIDYPYELPQRSILEHHEVERVPYKDTRMHFKHYGAIVEVLIAKAIAMEDPKMRNDLITMIANHMKKSIMIQNKDLATDDRIFNDIKIMSDGKLIVDSSCVKTAFYNESVISQAANSRKCGNNLSGGNNSNSGGSNSNYNNRNNRNNRSNNNRSNNNNRNRKNN